MLMHIHILYVYVHFVKTQKWLLPGNPRSTGKSLVAECVNCGFDVHQAEFARELSISQGQLSRYEQGRSEIGAEVFLRLARKSGKTIEWLLTGKDRENCSEYRNTDSAVRSISEGLDWILRGRLRTLPGSTS